MTPGWKMLRHLLVVHIRAVDGNTLINIFLDGIPEDPVVTYFNGNPANANANAKCNIRYFPQTV